MEKEKKTPAKKVAAKKTTIKKVEPKVVESKKEVKVEKHECVNILNKIFIALIVIAVIQGLVLVTLLVKGTSFKTNNETSTEETEQSNTEYDVSMFNTLSTTDALSKIKDGKRHVVYIGRSTCGYCVQFLPNLQKAQQEYGYETIYIDLEKMSSDDQTNLLKVDDKDGYIKENFGYTPMVLIFKDGKLSKGWVGYSEYDQFASFLEENGIKK